MERWISCLGLLVMILLAWLLSSERRRVPVRVIVGGLALQFAFAILILRTELGRAVFDSVGEAFKSLLAYVDQGTDFLFRGYVIGPDGMLALKILPTIIFFSAFMSLLYHLGVVQLVVRFLAWTMRRTLGTSGSESLAAAANIFVGQTEAPLVVKPYIASMTVSELMAMMVGGFATVAGGVFAFYVSLGIDAGHLLTASVISAPAALLIAKVLQPEVEESPTLGEVRVQIPREATNLLDALARGTADGLKLALNVGAMLIVFLALIALANGIVGWVGERWFESAWSLEKGLGVLFWPFAWLMGVPASECGQVGELLGIKMVANEAVAYMRMSPWIEGETRQISERSEVIATYALCGFANFASIGIQLGGIGPLAPTRQAELARLGLRAMLGGTLAAFMTACVAGILI